MKPLLPTVVALSLLLTIQALPENIEDVKQLSQSKEPVVEAEESEPQTRVERCAKCTGTILKIKTPDAILAALQALPSAEVHTQQSFEGCSSDKGCAGLKLKDGKVIERFGNVDAFKAAAAADVNNEFNFHAGFAKNVLGASSNDPFWWMNQDSPFKSGASSGSYKDFSSASSSYTSGSAGGVGSLDLAANPFLNGAQSVGFKPSFQSSSYEASSSSAFNKEVDISKNPFLNGGFKAGQAGVGVVGVGGAVNQGYGASGSVAGYDASAVNSASVQGFDGFASGSKVSTGYAGSTPAPFATPVSGISLIQNEKANSFDFEQQTLGIDKLFQAGSVGVDTTAGGLEQTCAAEGYSCVSKAQCSSGVAYLQINPRKQYCNVLTEVCCRIEIVTVAAGQANLGVGATVSQGSYTGQSAGFGVQDQTSQSGFGSYVGAAGTTFGSNVAVNRGVGSTGYGATVIPVTPKVPFKGTVQTNVIEDTVSAGSINAGVYRPGAVGSNLKPGIPYLPPVDNTKTGTNIVSSTVYPTLPPPTFVTTPRPIPVKPTYIPPVTSTSAPGYLPPIGEQTINRETYVPPNPTYTDGKLILDVNRQPVTPAPVPIDIPVGCAAALKCTPIEYCTADGIVSNTTVVLTREQNIYRVPLTDCKDLETGRIGKCCRDPFYTDPWPASQLGKWIPGVFGNDGKYVPEVRNGSIILNHFMTTKSPTYASSTPNPFQKVQIGIGKKGQVGVGGQGQYTQRGQGQYAQVDQGLYGQKGQGQIIKQGVGIKGQFGVGRVGTQTQFGVGQKAVQGQGIGIKKGQGAIVTQATAASGTQGQGILLQGQREYGTRGQGAIVSQGVGTIGSQGQGAVITQGEGAIVSQGFGTGIRQGVGQQTTQGQGEIIRQGVGQVVRQGQGEGVLVSQGLGAVVSQGQGQLVTQGFGTGIRQGVGQQTTQGQGEIVRQGVGQVIRQGEGQYVSQGQGAVVSQGQGQFVTQGQGALVSQGEGQVVSQGFGTGIRQGVGQQTTQGQGAVIRQGVGQTGQGQVVTQGQGAVVSQGTGAFVSQEEGQLVSQGFGTGIRQGVGQQVSQGQGEIIRQGVGQVISQGEGALVSQGFGTGIRQGLGQQTSQNQGAIISQGVGQTGQGLLVSQGQGAVVSQGEGQLVTQGFGAGIRQGVGQQTTQGQGEVVRQGVGQVIRQGEGQYVSQGQGAVVSQGEGQLVSQGFGTGIRQGFGQQTTQGQGQYVTGGQGLLVSKGFGQKIRQDQGVSVSQGNGFGVDNEYGESVHRVYLKEYNGGGKCGLLNGQKPKGNRNNLEVDFAEIPWQAMVLLQTNKSLLCGGVITRPDVVVTSAACVEGLDAKNVLIKGGEWKLGIDEEPLPFQIVQVKTILRHPFYKPGSLLYDAAILVLNEDLRFAKNIYPICMPEANEAADAYYKQSEQCMVTGWGKQVLQAHLLGSIMHSMNVTVIAPGECQAKLSSDYPHLLDQYDEQSCICGEPTNPLNNICKVDIGSALACTNGDGHYIFRGVYSWDSGCQVGNQLAAFYKFDLEWYRWSIGLIESVRFAQYTTITKVTTGIVSGIKGTKGAQYGIKGTDFGVKGTQYGVKGTQFGVKGTQFGVKGTTDFGVKGTQFGVKGSQVGTGQGTFGIANGFGFDQSLLSQVNEFNKKISSTSSQADFGTAFNFSKITPITNGFTATHTEKKVFQTEPKITYTTFTTKPEYVTYTTKPEYVTYTTKPEYVTYTTKPEIVTYTTKPEIVTYTTKPEIVTYTTKPKYITYTTKPEIVTFTTKPKIVTYTTKPEIVTYTTKPEIISFTTKPKYFSFQTKPQIVYETSGSRTSPQYVAPSVSFNPSYSEIVGQHTHTAKCKCLEGKK